MLVLIPMLMLQASVDFFVLSFVSLCAYANVASEDHALSSSGNVVLLHLKLDWRLSVPVAL